jgi:hypothetical protein
VKPSIVMALLLLTGLAEASAATLQVEAKSGSALSAAAASAVAVRYVAQNDTIYDKATGLTWARCSVGQIWNGTGCEGTVKLFNYIEAQRQGGNGWRVPTLDELKTLIAYSKVQPAINKVAFPNMDLTRLSYWTSTPDGEVYAWSVLFFDGRIDNVHRAAVKAVRLVEDKR